MSESRRGDPKPISGLDMAPTISWYTTNKDKLSKLLPPSVEEPSPFPTMDGDYFSITDGEIASLVALFVSYLVGSLVSIALLLTGRLTRKSQVPFGPFLVIGTLTALFYGDLLIQRYLELTLF